MEILPWLFFIFFIMIPVVYGVYASICKNCNPNRQHSYTPSYQRRAPAGGSMMMSNSHYNPPATTSQIILKESEFIDRNARVPLNFRGQHHNFENMKNIPEIVPPDHIHGDGKDRMMKLNKQLMEKESRANISFSEKRRRDEEERKYVAKYGKGNRYIPPAVRRMLQAKQMNVRYW